MKEIKQKLIELNEKEQEIIEAYRNMKNITGSDEWIVCNPSTMWSEYFIPASKIKEKIKELEKERQKYREENTRIDEDYFFDINGFDNAILVLQELLEGK